MLGDIVMLTILVKDVEAAVKRYETLFDLKVHSRVESETFGGFKSAFLSLDKGRMELMQPTSSSSAAGRFLETHGEGIYMVSFHIEDIPASVKKLRESGARVTQFSPEDPVAWVHPKDAHGVLVELRKPTQYS
ncbi:VOC family protein [Chloroflexota bacterium]